MARSMPRGDVEIDLPWWLPVFSAAIPSAVALAALHNGRPGWSTSWAAVLAGTAVLPFVLDALDLAVPFRLSLPTWLFVPVVVAPVTLLLLRPAALDLIPFILVFLCAEMATRLDGLARFGVALLCVGVMVGIEAAGVFDGAFIWVVGILFGWGGGFLVQQMMSLTTRLKEAQADLAQKAAADERSRIAREIHDVIAHSMSVTMLHITAARMALERDRTDDALEALREAEQQGRNALNEIRRTVGLLGPDEAASAPPMPTAKDLPKLVADFRSAGLDVELQTDGDVEAMPPAAGLNVYRIVQESLTNVAKHAPGAKATVLLQMTDADLRLLVRNSRGNGARPTISGSGLGVKGMAGRAAMLGGSLEADDDGTGWTVSLVAPRPTA